MASKPFQEGDVVKLKSGGRHMTVEEYKAGRTGNGLNPPIRMRLILSLMASVCLAGCLSAGSVQRTPVALTDGTIGYVYKGRSNSGSQYREAEDKMYLHCRELGHRHALIVDRRVDSQSYGIINPVYSTGSAVSGGGGYIGTDTEHWIVFRCV